MKRSNITVILAVFLVILGASTRILNAQLHLPNLAPLSAIALFSGYMIKEKRSLAFLVALLGQFIADVYFQLFTNIPGFYDLAGQLFNYAALVAAAGLGSSMKQAKPVTALTHLFGASTAFFLISNFGYFVHGWNGYSFAGLVKTYVDGIPFFKYTMMGDMAGGILLFGGYYFARQSEAKKAIAA